MSRSRLSWALVLVASGAALGLLAPAAIAGSFTTPSVGRPWPVLAQRTPLPSGFQFSTPLPAKTPGNVTPLPVRTPPLDSRRIQAWFAAGQALRPDSTPDATQIVAMVGRIEVQRRQLTYAAVLSSRIGANDDPRTILQRLRTPLAIEDEAQARGFVPSAAELAGFVASQRARAHADAEGAAEFAAFLSGLGVTEDAYYALPDVAQDLSYEWGANRMFESVTATVPIEDRSTTWETFSQALAMRVTVTILDPALR